MPRITNAEMREVWRKMPRVKRSYDALAVALAEEGTLGAALQDMIRIRSAQLNHCMR